MPLHLTRRRVIASSLLAIAMAGDIGRAFAQTPEAAREEAAAPRFAIHPLGTTSNGYPEVELNPGERGEIRIGVTIEDPASADLTLYRADASPAAGGGFAAAEFDAEPTGNTLWLDIEPTTFPAEPGNTYEFTVPVAVPEDATPGQYVTAMVVQTGPLAISGDTMFDQVIRSALSVVINVPGEIAPGMDVGVPDIAVRGGLRFIRIPISNSGNILIKPEGTVDMATPDGGPLITAPVAMKPIYLGQTAEIRVAIPDHVPPGDYLVSYDLREPEHGLRATRDAVAVALAPGEAADTSEAATLVITPVAVTPIGNPLTFAEVAVTVVNTGPTIPTARVSLVVLRDGEEVETYDLANNQALPQGASTVNQRYLPATGWQLGTWTFRIVVTAVDASGAETALAEMEVADQVVVP